MFFFQIGCFGLYFYFVHCTVLHLTDEDIVKPGKPLGGTLAQNLRRCFLEDQMPLQCSRVYIFALTFKGLF